MSGFSMGGLDNPLDLIEEPEKRDASRPGKRGKGKKEFDNPIDAVDRAAVAKATGSGNMRGQYWQRTLRLPPEYQDLTARIFSESRAKSIAEIERWIYAMGLHAYFVEGKRPEYTPSVARDIVLPDVKSEG